MKRRSSKTENESLQSCADFPLAGGAGGVTRTTSKRALTQRLCAASVALAACLSAFAQGTSFTFEGSLSADGSRFTGDAEFQATLWDAGTGGTQIAANSPPAVIVPVTNGLFVMPLDFGASFPGASRWLQLEVRTSIGPFTLLSPRQKVTTVPYAITAGAVSGPVPAAQVSGTLPNATLAGTYSGAIHLSNSGNSFSGDGANLSNVNAATLGGSSAADFWHAVGNAGTTAGTHFVGTTDNQPLEFRVNNQRGLRLEPGNWASVNVLGGWPGNTIAANLAGATLAGGGAGNASGTVVTNRIEANFATIGGGGFNLIQQGSPSATIAGGWQSVISSNSAAALIGSGTGNRIQTGGANAVIAGGYHNTIQTNALHASIVGGIFNKISAEAWGSFTGGGQDNTIGTNALYATIAGGSQNQVSVNAHYAMIPGGNDNTAGKLAFAAGNHAQALHTGAFVWADSQEAYFTSTGANQFLIRAGGGVGIGTGAPQAPLHLLSSQNSTVFRIQSTAAPGFGRVEFVSDPQGSPSEWRPGYIQSTDNGGFTGGLAFVVNGSGSANRFAEVETMRIVNGRVGIGTTAPSTLLHVGGATCNGTTWNNASDRNAKENFRPVNGQAVLDKVAALPLTEWNYKADTAAKHVGPMAQDFYAAFGTGSDDKHISTVDADGVALAAIQGLNEKLEGRSEKSEVRIQKLEAENAELHERLERLERLIAGHVE